MAADKHALPWRTARTGTSTDVAVAFNTHIHTVKRAFYVSWRAKASVDLANVHTGLRIRTVELHPDNPISVSSDCHTDQPDPVWKRH